MGEQISSSKRSSISKRRPASWQIDWNAVLHSAKEIVESYDTGVTLRQLYYRLVSTGVIPNQAGAYKTLSAKSAAARREGWFPSLIDRTRAIEAFGTFESPVKALEDIASGYRRDRTEGQKTSIYLGVEKHGMTVQLMHWFGQYGVPVLALGGYSSQTFVDVVAADIERQERPAILLYAGDHDPSGEDIDRDFEERTEIFSKVYRVALTSAQVKKYDLPPMPGKQTDSRSARFIMKHGELVQVELDALPPEELRKLYEKALFKHFNKKVWEKVKAQEEEERLGLRDALAVAKMDNPIAQSLFLLDKAERKYEGDHSSDQLTDLLNIAHDLEHSS